MNADRGKRRRNKKRYPRSSDLIRGKTASPS